MYILNISAESSELPVDHGRRRQDAHVGEVPRYQLGRRRVARGAHSRRAQRHVRPGKKEGVSVEDYLRLQVVENHLQLPGVESQIVVVL